MAEIWKDIKGYEGLYQVSNMGRVRSLDRIMHEPKTYTVHGKVLKPGCNGRYLFVVLVKNGVKKPKSIHRMVAETFIENPDGLHYVNHKDENKQNNCVENLEWCTQAYNANYGTRNQKISIAKKNSLNVQSVIYEFEGIEKSLKQWANHYGMSYQLFYSRWRKGKRGKQLFKGYIKEEGLN